jgi:hypothetical protein
VAVGVAGRRDLECEPVAVALHLDHCRMAADPLHERPDVVERLNGGAVYRGDAISLGEHTPGGGMRLDAAHPGR